MSFIHDTFQDKRFYEKSDKAIMFLQETEPWADQFETVLFGFLATSSINIILTGINEPSIDVTR